MKKILYLLVGLLLASPALGQPVQGQLPSGTFWGNSTAARAPAAPTSPSALIDRAISGVQGAVLTRNGSAWIGLAPGTVGLPLLSGGPAANLAYGIPALAAGGTGANLTASTGGIFYSGASAGAILSGTATARQMVQSGASAAPAWSTTTWPATTSAGRILASGTANTITDTSTPTLGASGTLGSVTFGNATSGLVTVQPVTGALGTVSQLLPAASGTFAVSATSPIVLGASSGALTCPTCVTSSGGGAITGTAPIAVSAAGAVSLNNAGVTYAKIQDLGALAIMGRSANTSGVGADIAATAASGAVLRESGSTIGFGTIATAGIANNAVTLAKLATQAANTALVNATAGAAVPTAFAMPSCSTAASAINWTTSTGYGCNTSITAAAVPASGLTGSTLAAGVTGSSLTSVGTLTGGATGAGFTVALGTSTITGQLGLTNGGTNNTLTASNGGIVYSDATKLNILAGTVTANQCLLSGSSSAPSWGSCSGGAAVTSLNSLTGGLTIANGNGIAAISAVSTTITVSADIASASQIWSTTANKLIDAAGFNTALALTSLTDAATIAVDFNTGRNFTVTLGGNRTLGNPTNVNGVTSGCIYVVQPSSGGPWTLTLGSNWKVPGGTAPVFSTAANAVDQLCYIARSSTFISANVMADVK